MTRKPAKVVWEVCLSGGWLWVGRAARGVQEGKNQHCTLEAGSRWGKHIGRMGCCS